MKVEESMPDQAADPPPPPPPPRRPRVREVSSRFMTPAATHSSSSSTFSPTPNQKQRSSSVQRQPRHLEFEPLGFTGENRSMATENSSSSSSSSNRSSPLPRQRTAAKPLKENAGSRNERSHRPDTPMLSASSSLAPSSKLRAIQQRCASTVSAAAKLLQSNGMSSSSSSPSSNQSCNCSDLSESNSSRSSSDNNDSTWSLPDLRPSTSEPDLLPTSSSRLLLERNVNRQNGTPVPDFSSKFSASPCSRSLNLQRSMSDHPLFQSLKSADPKLTKLHISSGKMSGGPPLPPIPSCGKPPSDVGRKGRKDEDVHTLRMLHNHYLQWRYANAKANAFIQSQSRQTERSVYSLGIMTSELCDSVKRKRIELALLQRMRIVSTIVDSQMLYLEEWSDFEAIYSISLSEAIQALSNASVQLPTSGNVRVEVSEMEEALNYAMKLMKSIAISIQSFIPKAEETENFISQLAILTGGERALIEECGVLLTMMNKWQVEECSLHAQLVQLNRSCHGQLLGVVQ